MLSNERVFELVNLAKAGEDSAKQELLESNYPLIKSIIKRYIGKGVDYDDLFQLGCMGFIKAINKYDESYKVKFTTYAVPLIAGEVKRFLRDDGSIKVSRSVKTLYTKIKRVLIAHQNDEVQPTVDYLAAQLEVTREEIIFAMEAAQMPLSLFEKNDHEGEGEGLNLAERIPAPQNTDIIDRILIKNMLASLELRDRKVMILRFFRNQTQSQVATRLGISQVQVSRIEQRILAQFKEHLAQESG